MIEAVYNEFQICREKEVFAKKTFKERDIRISYWNGSCEILRFLYTGLKQLELGNYVHHHKILLKHDNLKAGDLELQKWGHINMFNSKLIIDSWSNFELLVTMLCEKTLSQTEIGRIKEEAYSRVIECLPLSCRTADAIENLDYLKKEHIAHSSMPRKYNALFKITKQGYLKAQKKEDRNFLEFFGKLRNCIHSNYIYFVRIYPHPFKDVRFTFTNNMIILTEPSRPDTIIEIFKMLNQIVERLINNLEYDDLIDDPTYDLLES